MNTIIKTSLVSYLAVLGALGSVAIVASESSAPAAKTASVEATTKLDPKIPEAYILYSLALRDGKAADKSDPTMSVVNDKGKATYTFKEHVLKECGSHLNGTIEVLESGSKHKVTATFPHVVNTMGITHFSLQMTEEKANKVTGKGEGQVNDLSFAVADIVTLPGFVEALAKMQ